VCGLELMGGKWAMIPFSSWLIPDSLSRSGPGGSVLCFTYERAFSTSFCIICIIDIIGRLHLYSLHTLSFYLMLLPGLEPARLRSSWEVFFSLLLAYFLGSCFLPVNI
jgi:hypothetical protein